MQEQSTTGTFQPTDGEILFAVGRDYCSRSDGK
jgi:hypothetical protein